MSWSKTMETSSMIFHIYHIHHMSWANTHGVPYKAGLQLPLEGCLTLRATGDLIQGAAGPRWSGSWLSHGGFRAISAVWCISGDRRNWEVPTKQLVVLKYAAFCSLGVYNSTPGLTLRPMWCKPTGWDFIVFAIVVAVQNYELLLAPYCSFPWLYDHAWFILYCAQTISTVWRPWPYPISACACHVELQFFGDCPILCPHREGPHIAGWHVLPCW